MILTLFILLFIEAYSTSVCATMTSSVDVVDPPTDFVVSSCDGEARYFCAKEIPGI